MKIQDKLEVALPFFGGFYNSELSDLMDREIEQEAEFNGKEVEYLHDIYNYQKAMEAISKGWVQAFSKETGIPLEYGDLSSPKEYNFTTDRVFAFIPVSEVLKLESIRATEEFKTFIREWFTSYDGFMSFYDNDPESDNWQRPVVEWDHNELSALLAAFVLRNHGDKDKFLMELFDNSEVYEAAQYGWEAEPAVAA
jgi:hypothetical protein